MSPFAIPVKRPVATSMFFLGLALMGVIGWQRIPVLLFPPIAGNELNVSYARPGSEPEVVEREILMPLEARVGELLGVEETWGEVRGSSGTFRVRFESDTDLGARELELSRMAAELERGQPPGTSISVQQDLFSRITNSRFAMYVQVTGMDDRDSLGDFVEQRIVPRLAAVPGVSRVLDFGGAPRELSVWVDPDRSAAAGVAPEQVVNAVRGSLRRPRYVGGVEDGSGRTAVMLDGRPAGTVSLAELQITPTSAARLRHVSLIEVGVGRELAQYRVNGEPAVGLILFQNEGTNLVALCRSLRARLDELSEEFRSYGIGFVVNYDGGDEIERQLSRLRRLALSGFAIALLVLYLFLRQWRGVATVGIAVPVSLLGALALLYLAGQSLNVITLFGLAIGIGMLVDNSIVVYEAVQRQIEHGAEPDQAAEAGVRRTFRAILAATLTNAIVFLPIAFADFDNAALRSLLEVLALAILLPMVGSLLVAVGLVPLLARWLAAPAATARLATQRLRRAAQAGLAPPDRARELFGGLLTAALRRPGGWLTGIVAAVLVTLFVLIQYALVGGASSEAADQERIQLPVSFASGGSLDRALGVFERLEGAALAIDGVLRVESVVQEQGGTLTVFIPPRDERPRGLSAGLVRMLLRQRAQQDPDVSINASSGSQGNGQGGGGLAGLVGQSQSRVVLSGPDAHRLEVLAEDIKARLESISEVASASFNTRAGQDEIRVVPRQRALERFGLRTEEVMPALAVVRREGVPLQTGYTLQNGREIPVVVRRLPGRGSVNGDLRQLRLATAAGVLPLEALATVRKMPPPATIRHHDGRREVEVSYTLSADAPESGPARVALEERIQAAIHTLHLPAGYTLETPDPDESLAWFKGVLVAVVLLLLAVLAVTFESLTLPLLVLLALPLTMLGATWAPVVAGMSLLDPMALVGLIALIGLTVNPAILLVDRMQQRAWGGGWSPGAAALAAVRERTRPVLMTAATTIAGLWPLALTTGQQNEIWPPFATIVMGGLATSTVLTLLVVPVGFVFLHRLDRIFGRLGPWVVLGIAAVTAAVIVPLAVNDVITSLTWQVLTTLLVAGLLTGLSVLVLNRPEAPVPEMGDGPPAVRTRVLHKIYGQPGPIGRAWRATERHAQRVLAAGGRAFDPVEARARIVPLLLLLAGAVYLALRLERVFWRMVFVFVAAGLVSWLTGELRRARGHADELGRPRAGGPEALVASLLPWLALTYVTLSFHVRWRLAAQRPELPLWLLIAVAILVVLVVIGRKTALSAALTGAAGAAPATGLRKKWRRFSQVVFGLDLPKDEVHALRGVQVQMERGMVGILGPNGAGKTTLLRLLAGILEPSVGRITLGGVPLGRLRRTLARYLGYLPQEFGLPDDLTGRQYLEYYALLYEIGPQAERAARIQRLLDEVGLGDKADHKIGGYSGGMRQRVAVARTLLRLPPVIIVDEPTVGLDPRERIRFRNLLSRLAEGRVVLFSTHVVEDVAAACERVIVMARGRMVFDGDPARLADQAAHRVWVVDRPPEDSTPLASGALIVDEVPEETGWVRCRVLCERTPHPDAQPATPTLEDGYFLLLGEESVA